MAFGAPGVAITVTAISLPYVFDGVAGVPGVDGVDGVVGVVGVAGGVDGALG